MRALLRAIAGVLALLNFAATAMAGEAHWPDHLVIATASPGGTYDAYGAGLARILTRALDLPVVARNTEGPAENIGLVETGEAQLAFVTTGIALQAWNATGGFAGRRPARAMRAIFPMYDTPFQFLALEASGIGSLAQMAGKRIGIGPRGGTTAAYAPEFFKVLKLQSELVHGDWADLAARLHAREIDGLAVGAGIPFPSFLTLEASDKVRYLALAPGEITALRLALPELAPSRVPAGSYPSLLRSQDTVGLFNFAVAHADLPDDLVLAVVRAAFENHDEMIEAHPAAAATIPANIERNTFLPLHPGAIRYYRQVGRAGQSD
jgi:uncharacterized protein